MASPRPPAVNAPRENDHVQARPNTKARGQFLKTTIGTTAAVMADAATRLARSAGTSCGCGVITMTFALLRYL